MKGDKLVEVYTKIKRMDFLSALIREKNEGIASLTAEAAELRKKNGRAYKSDIDLLIYQINMKISSQQKSVAACKEEIRSLRSESGELLREIYPEAETEEDRKLVVGAMNKVYLGKASLTNAEDEGGVFGNCDIVAAVTTQDRQKRNCVSSLVRAGIRTDMGKTLAAPEIEVYDYDPKAEEGVRRAETNEFRQVLARRSGREPSRAAKYFADVFKHVVGSVALVFVVAAFLAVALIGAGGGFTSGERADKLFFEHSLITCGFALLMSLVTVRSAKRGGPADFVPMAFTAFGIILFICKFAYPSGGFGLLPAVFMTVYGLIALLLRIFVTPKETNNDEVSILSGGFLGGTLAYFFRAVYLTVRSVESGRTWGYITLGVIALLFLLAGMYCLVRFGEKSFTATDSFVVAAAVFFCMLAFTLGAAPLKTAALWAVGGVYSAVVVARFAARKLK